MTAISSYNTLLQALVDTAEDNGAEFLAYIPTAIDLAEERLFKELDLPDLEKRTSGTLTPNNPTLPKPGDYQFGGDLYVTSGTSKVQLKLRMEDFLVDYWPDQTQTNVPKYYSHTTDSSFMLAPTPSQAFQYDFKYTAKPVKLSVTNQTNYFTEQLKDCLFYASMLEMVTFMKAWEQLETWNSKFVNARDTWNIEMSRKRRDNGETPRNTSSGPNSLKHTVNSAS